jgi:cell division protease FtsH
MVREFGLSAALGPVGYPTGGSVFLGGDGGAFSSRPFAEQTQAIIDAEVSRLLREAEQRAVGLLEEHRDTLESLVQLLLSQETVDGSQVYALAGVGEPTGGPGMTVAPERALRAEPHPEVAAGLGDPPGFAGAASATENPPGAASTK